MIQGSTPTHLFELPFSTEVINRVRVLYAQGDEVLFVKENDACTFDGRTIKVRLTQAETLLLDHKKPVQIQVRAMTTGGDSLVSPIKRVEVGQCLDDEVLECV